MRGDGGGRFRGRQVEVLVHLRDVDAGGAGKAVVAVNAFALRGKRFAEHCGKVLLRVGRGFVGDGLAHLFGSRAAYQGGCRRRACQRVMDALRRGQRPAERGLRRVQQAPRHVRLHHGDRDPAPLAEQVKLLALWVDAVLHRRAGFLAVHHVVDGHVARQEVEGGVQAEKQRVNESGFHRALGEPGYVRAEADRLYHAAFLELDCVVDYPPAENAVEALVRVHEVQDPDVDARGSQPREQVVESAAALREVAAQGVLPVLPGRSDVPLYDDLIPPTFQAPCRYACARPVPT